MVELQQDVKKLKKVLAHVSAELQNKTKENQYGLQLSIQDTLKQYECEHAEKIEEQNEQIQYYESLSEDKAESTVKVQGTLAQLSAKLQEKTEESLKLMENQNELQSTIQKLEEALRQSKSEHDNKIAEYTKQIEQYKNLSDAEKETAIKMQDNLAQVSTKLQEKTKETIALKESQDELQSTIQKLKEALKQSKIEHDEKINECTKEIQYYKDLSNTKKEITNREQDTSTQVSAELEEKTKENLALKERQRELQSNVQKLENALKKSKSDHNRKISQHTTESKHYENLISAEKEEKIKAQQTLAQLLLELKEKENETSDLMKSKYELQSNVQKLQNALKQYTNEYDNKPKSKEYTRQIECDAETEGAVKVKDNLTQALAELQEKAKETVALKESQHVLQSTIQKLKDTLELSKSEYDKKIEEHIEQINHYQNLVDAEKEKTIKEKDTLTKLSAELREKAKETVALKEKLEDALKQSKSEYDKKIEEHVEQIRHHQYLLDAEKENTIREQDTLTKVSAKLQEKVQETLILKESQCELQAAVKELEDTLRQSKSECNNKTTEYIKEIERYRNLNISEQENAVKIQNKLTLVTGELQEAKMENLVLKKKLEDTTKGECDGIKPKVSIFSQLIAL